MGLDGSATCELIFEDAMVPVENFLGAEGQGFKNIEEFDQLARKSTIIGTNFPKHLVYHP